MTATMDYDSEYEYLVYICASEISGGYREPEQVVIEKEVLVYVPSGAPVSAQPSSQPGAGHHIIQPGTDPNKHIVKPGDHERMAAARGFWGPRYR